MAFDAVSQLSPGLGDAGAHVGEIIDADSTTFVLASLARDRRIMTIPEAVHKLTGMPASVLGLRERPSKEGWHADLNIIDLEALGSRQPVYLNTSRITVVGLSWKVPVMTRPLWGGRWLSKGAS